jgi:MinD superfamily P-loop ATPase
MCALIPHSTVILKDASSHQSREAVETLVVSVRQGAQQQMTSVTELDLSLLDGDANEQNHVWNVLLHANAIIIVASKSGSGRYSAMLRRFLDRSLNFFRPRVAVLIVQEPEYRNSHFCCATHLDDWATRNRLGIMVQLNIKWEMNNGDNLMNYYKEIAETVGSTVAW